MACLISYCGLVCSDCEAYLATQADDREALERVAAHWREAYSAPSITVESVICDGCTTRDGRHCGHWIGCEIRVCGMARGVVNCAYCDDYGCEKLEGLFAMVPAARSVLDEIRLSL